MSAVLVVVPAHDEEEEIGACLDHVAAAVRVALAEPEPPRTAVLVGAHRCHDDTFDRAVRTLAGLPVPCRVLRDDTSVSVGDVRARLVAEGHRMRLDEPQRTWVLNTDADSWVPPGWIVQTLLTATKADVAAVTGMVELRGWAATPRQRERYAELIAAKLLGATHTHVYGANLAVRLDLYLRVGGFRAVVGEDQDLVDRLLASGAPVLGAFAPVVATSARMPGRAGAGLGALLERLADENDRAPHDRREAAPRS